MHCLVPYLKLVQECREIPKEICSFGLKPFYFGELANKKNDLIRETSSQPLIPPPLPTLGKNGRKENLNEKKRMNPRTSRLIDLLETVKQDPEGGKNILKHEQKSRPGFDDLVPDVFRFPKDLLSKKSIFTSQSKADGKHREDGGRRIEFELDSLPVEFETIVSKLDKSANKLIQIKRAKQSEINQSDKAIARVVKHKDNPLSQTVFIQNFSEVHKAVGVRNASDNLQNTNKLPENTSEEKRSPEFLFTDDKIINERKPQIKTVIIKNSKTEFAKFGVKNVPREFLNHLPEQRTKKTNKISR